MSSELDNASATEATNLLYLNEKFADVHFVFENGDKVPASKAILGVLSPVFDTMFFGSMREQDDVKITDADSDAFKDFLQFFYKTKVNLSIENIETVAYLADKYDMLDRVNACVAFLKREITMDNICWGYQLAIFLKNDDLKEFCEKKIIISPKEVFSSDVFRRCDKETLEHILALNLTCKEADIFIACLDWAKQSREERGDSSNLRDHLGDCLKLISFCTMEFKEFTMIYAEHKGLFTPDEFEDIVLSLGDKGYEPHIFKMKQRQYVWNPDVVLHCQRVSNSYDYCSTRSLEKISFTSSHPVLLGEFRTFEISHNYFHSNIIFPLKVTIIGQEIPGNHDNSHNTVLYEGSVNAWANDRLCCVLPSPILIKPQVLYEISIHVGGGGYYNSTSQLNLIVDVGDGLTIQFHRDPSLGYDNTTSCWIEELVLNRI